MDKYLTSSQPDEVNNKINELRYKAFHSNKTEDREELMYYVLHKWIEGELVSRDLMESIYG